MAWEVMDDGKFLTSGLEGSYSPKHTAQGYQSETWWAPTMSIPKENPFWYKPMGAVHLTIGQTVEFALYDGTGRYYRGTVLSKRKGIEEGVWEYEIGSGVQLTLF